MRYIELFAGIGGMGYGLMQAGMECVGYCEIDKYAHKAFQLLHDPEERMWNAYDVRSVTDDDLRLLGDQRGPIDLIAGGFPCQAFSIAGKRKGFQDSTRGTLFFEIVRFASILRPKYLLLENVTGLLSHDEGRTFETVIRTLDELGYVGEWCVLNSAAYVPQNRERVFIVASLGGSGGRKIFPFGAENQNAINVIGRLDCYNDQNNRIYGIDGLSPTLPTMQGGGQEPKVMVVGNTNPSGNGMNGQVFDASGLAPTLTTNKGEGNRILHRSRIRKLTPLECFRLQSFPDEWYYTLKNNGISDSQLYKMAGNAVTSRVAYEIGRRLTA